MIQIKIDRIKHKRASFHTNWNFDGQTIFEDDFHAVKRIYQSTGLQVQGNQFSTLEAIDKEYVKQNVTEFARSQSSIKANEQTRKAQQAHQQVHQPQLQPQKPPERELSMPERLEMRRKAIEIKKWWMWLYVTLASGLIFVMVYTYAYFYLI